MENKSKTFKVEAKSAFKKVETNKNFPDVNLADTLNDYNIKTKNNKYKIHIQPHHIDRFKDFTEDKDTKLIDLFCALKYQEIAWYNKTKKCLDWFANDKNNHNFGICVTEKDRQHLIKAFPKTALNTVHIQHPMIHTTKITKDTKKLGNNIMWLGAFKDISFDSYIEAIKLAKTLKTNNKKQKIFIVGVFKPDSRQEDIGRLLQLVKTTFNLNTEELVKELKNNTDDKQLEKVLNDFLEKQEYSDNIEFKFNCDESEIDKIAEQCDYCYKPEARGLSETASVFSEATSRGLIMLADYGYVTEKDYVNGGRFSKAVVLGDKYEKGSTNKVKQEIRFTAAKAYDKIMEIEKDKELKKELIKNTFDLYEKRFKSDVVKKLYELHIGSLDSEKYSDETNINNNLDDNNLIFDNNKEIALIRKKDKYKDKERRKYVVREKMLEIKNITFALIAELGLEIEDACEVFKIAKKHNGFTNSKEAMELLKKYCENNANKIERMKEFSKLFQYYANQNDILSPKSFGPEGNKVVGLGTKRVLDFFNGNTKILQNFLTKNTTELQLGS